MVFGFVYISEAHAANEWPVGHDVIVNQPETSEERLVVAREKLADLGVGDEFICMVDSAEHNNFHNMYASWPLRWYTTSADRRLTSIAQPKNSSYDFKELFMWVEEQLVL